MEAGIIASIIAACAAIIVAVITRLKSRGSGGEDDFVTTLTETIGNLQDAARTSLDRIAALEASDRAKDQIITDQAREIEKQAARIAHLEKHNNDTALFVAEVIAWAKWAPEPPPRELPQGLTRP